MSIASAPVKPPRGGLSKVRMLELRKPSPAFPYKVQFSIVGRAWKKASLADLRDWTDVHEEQCSLKYPSLKTFKTL